ncbi:SpoIIE family protein phosphatase [Cytobacillus sp. Hz8]|uniref:SpoIIE family protein phosphatase n=1 Tax=Cytobacillus sp. Hz8 TaxID=3347168 RepID=UPI0035DF43CA
MIFFYTDGIIAAQNKMGEQDKIERQMQVLLDNREKNEKENEKGVLASIADFTLGVPQKDDITMVLLKIEE